MMVANGYLIPIFVNVTARLLYIIILQQCLMTTTNTQLLE